MTVIERRTNKINWCLDMYNQGAKVREICDLMSRDSYLELEDEKTESYKVLDSYAYLLDVINSIAIYEEGGSSEETQGIIYN